jgi:hypothetical protein
MKRKRDYKREYRRRLQLRELREQQLAAPVKVRRRKRRRDYKKEYQARKLRELESRIQIDARRLFGRKPKRERAEGANEYEEKLTAIIEERNKREKEFQWTNEHEFIAALTTLGKPVQEAYTLWFSP